MADTLGKPEGIIIRRSWLPRALVRGKFGAYVFQRKRLALCNSGLIKFIVSSGKRWFIIDFSRALNDIPHDFLIDKK